MKKTVISFLLTLSLLSSGCFLTKNPDSNELSSYLWEFADKKARVTIGNEFLLYSLSDDTLTSETLVSRKYLLSDWEENGSTLNTYTQIVGTNNDGPYIVYVDKDDKLNSNDKKARMLNIESWKTNLDNKKEE